LENDGEGDENERYNCYDDAGYTNVDQCYKFETHTRLEPAYESDLNLADDQGSILFIKANGRSYGRGEPYSTPFIGGWDWNVTPEQMMYISFGSIAVVWIAMLLFFHRRHKKKCKNIPGSFGDSLHDDDEYDSDDSDSTKASNFSKRSRAIYSPPTIELADTADYSAKAGCCAADPAIHLSQSDMDGAYSPPSVVDTNTVDCSTEKGWCAQDKGINLSESEMRSIESLDDDGKYKQLCYVNYNSYSGMQSDENTTLGTEHDRRCGIQYHGFNQTISEIESMDSDDQSQLKTPSSGFIGNVDTCDSEEDQSKVGDGERGSQPDILGMSESDVSSFDSMNHKANRLQQWISQQQQLAKPQCQEQHLPPTQILERVEEEKDDLGVFRYGSTYIFL
jgi:hypothetical protein